MPLIRCLTPFPGGTKLNHNGRAYHFMANEQNHFVAEVIDKDVPGILSISAGYQPYDPEDYESIVAQDDMVPDFDRTTKATAEGGATVEISRDYMRPATHAPKDTGKVNRTDQHKARVARGDK